MWSKRLLDITVAVDAQKARRKDSPDKLNHRKSSGGHLDLEPKRGHSSCKIEKSDTQPDLKNFLTSQSERKPTVHKSDDLKHTNVLTIRENYIKAVGVENESNLLPPTSLMCNSKRLNLH